MKTLIFALACGLAASTVALAHDGPRIFLGNQDGQVTTYLGDNDQSSNIFTPDRVFTNNLPNFLGSGIYTTDFPGFQVVEGTGVPSGTSFTFNIVSPLLYFDNYNAANASGVYRPVSIAFAGKPMVPQIAVSEGSNVRVTSDGLVSGFTFFTYTGAGDHGHVFFTLFGNGESASDGPGGIYALPLEATAPGMADSLPFYLLLGKDVALGTPEFIAAEAVARQTLVPEPTSFAVLALSTLGLLLRRTRTEA